MIVFLKCVAEAVVENGLKGLAGMVPGGEFAYDVAKAALDKYRQRQKDEEAKKEIEKLAQANFEEAKQAAIQAAKEVAAGVAADDLVTLEQYLTQIPASVQQSLKRPDDPSGKTVPASFALKTPEDVVKLLPPRPPRFRQGDPLPGRPGWVLERPLGVGGFGEVWLARHPVASSLARAVKFCRNISARDLRHESGVINRVMAAGTHPNIVPLLDAHLEGETPWLMFEYVGGGDLTDVARAWVRKPHEERVALAVKALRMLASAVGHFHRLTPTVVHRDLKPSNILWDRATGKLRVTDFGIGAVVARAALAEEASGAATRGGRLLSELRGSHTPLYSSPQQRAGADPDPRDDIHALGVIGYQLLTGRLDAGPGPRFDRDLRRSGAPDSLIDLIGDCVDQDPGHRPRNAVELLARLASLQSVPLPDPPPGPAPQRSQAAVPRTAPTQSPPVTPARLPPGRDTRPVPFPDLPMDAFRDKVRVRRQQAGHPADGRDIVYVYRTTANKGASHHPLFDLPPDAVRQLISGALPVEQTLLFIHRDKPSGEPEYDLLAPAAVPLIDPTTGTAPVTAPRLPKRLADERKKRLRRSLAGEPDSSPE